MRIDLLDRIEINPKVLLGKPVIKGTRISVELILERLAAGCSFGQVVDDYDIAEEDVRAAIAYAYGLVANEEILEISG